MPTWTSNIPSQVKNYANVGAFPSTGSVKTIYIAEDSNIAYYWNGSAYQAISIQDLSGLQTIPIVVNSNITAENNRVYHVVANATFTDPTPVEGRGYVVFLRNGTITIGGIPQSNNSIYYRLFLSGAWITYRFDNSVANNNNFVPQSRTINGKALSSNITLTPSDIGSPSGSGTSTGTNTGDQDLSGLVAKSDYTPAHSLLAQQSGTGSPTSVPIGTNEILGRLSGGGNNIKGLTASEVRTMLGITDWQDYSGTTIVVGFSSTTEIYVIYKMLDNQTMLVMFRISGTSNSENLTFSIPSNVRAGVGTITFAMFSCVNNGVFRWVQFSGIGGSNLITATPTATTAPTPGTWATSGTKTIYGTIIIPI